MMLLRHSEGIAAARAAGRTVGQGNSARIDREGIIAAPANGQSLRTVAKEFRVSLSTMERVLKRGCAII
ncbi:putative transposon Tn21 resolvase [Enterobacter cloacae S611]|uniref:Transposon Tn21 resolvase n=1 Tax=Enterobacter cloacae S611 TaxID=1399146 RepID=A0ABN0Q5S1_ENTCL|nr:putative transposon Tn21 resolvase [Enterobacter cloacae S611]